MTEINLFAIIILRGNVNFEEPAKNLDSVTPVYVLATYKMGTAKGDAKRK